MDRESPHQLKSSISSKFKIVETKNFLGDPFHPNEIKSPLKEGEFAMVPLRLNTNGIEDADMGFLGMLVKGVKNIARRDFYPESRAPSKEARLIVSADVPTIKVSPGTSLKDVMMDDNILAKIGLNTPYWVEILGDDRKPDRRYLVFRRKWGEQNLLVAINGEDSGMIGNVYELTEGNKFGKEVITIKKKDEKGETNVLSYYYDQLFREPESSLNILLYLIPHKASSESDKA